MVLSQKDNNRLHKDEYDSVEITSKTESAALEPNMKLDQENA